jgi:hypothetical protein
MELLLCFELLDDADFEVNVAAAWRPRGEGAWLQVVIGATMIMYQHRVCRGGTTFRVKVKALCHCHMPTYLWDPPEFECRVGSLVHLKVSKFNS